MPESSGEIQESLRLYRIAVSEGSTEQWLANVEIEEFASIYLHESEQGSQIATDLGSSKAGRFLLSDIARQHWLAAANSYCAEAVRWTALLIIAGDGRFWPARSKWLKDQISEFPHVDRYQIYRELIQYIRSYYRKDDFASEVPRGGFVYLLVNAAIAAHNARLAEEAIAYLNEAWECRSFLQADVVASPRAITRIATRFACAASACVC